MPYVTESEYSKMIDDVVKAQKAEDVARAEITQLRADLAAMTDERDTLRAWDNEFRAACGFKRDGRSSPECLKEYLDKVIGDLAAYESALEEIATYDTGATAGLAYTAQRALDTRRNK